MIWDATNFSVKMIRGMPDAVIYSDATGGFASGMRAQPAYSALAESEALGQTLEIIIPETLRDKHRAGFDKTMRTGKTVTGPERFWPCRRCVRAGPESRSSSPWCSSAIQPAR